ncbi:hypothetical protein [Geobacillus thermocatenulatus]|uniref:hypothetical protein n=1 Tax=Geobacillus thermocatenulatus TaxID=33938 RepID=UPI000473A797|nr:hypothetical protein [Geobacillus thermocatenulatus]
MVKEYEQYRLVRPHSAMAVLAAGMFGLLLFAAGRLPVSPGFYHSFFIFPERAGEKRPISPKSLLSTEREAVILQNFSI